MRNLKRVLSLTLASVMLFGMMVIGSSAAEVKKIDFTDANEIENTEAVNVMVALGVLEGNPDGGFNPKGTLTREQAAKIICYMLLGADNAEKLTANKDVFTDVAANRWSAGYISYCVERNILAGNGNGSFNPTGELTGVAFGKMLLVALGYDPTIQKYTGSSWSLSVAADMVDAGIAPAGVLLSAPMTREQAAQAAFQTLEADMVYHAQKGTYIDMGNGQSVLVNASEPTAVRSSSEDYTRDTTTDGKESTQQFCEKYFPKLKLDARNTVKDDFDRPGSEWQLDNNKICFAADDVTLTYTTDKKLSDIYKDLGKPDVNNVYFALNGKTDATATNGTPVNVSNLKTSSEKVGNKGAVTEIYKDGNNVTIIVVDTYLAQVKGDYKEKDEKLELDLLSDGPSGTKNMTLEQNDFGVSLDSFADEDYVLVTMATDDDGANYDVKSIALAETLTGSVDRYTSNKNVVVDGTTYEYNANCAYKDSYRVSAYEYTVDDDAVLILDNYGYVIGLGDAQSSSSYVFLYDFDTQGRFSDTIVADAYFADGTRDEVVVNKIGSTKVNALTQVISGKQVQNSEGWFTYSENDDGYNLTAVPGDRVKNQTSYSGTNAKIIENNKTAIHAAAAVDTSDDIYGTNSTVFIIKDGRDVDVYTGIKNVPTITTDATHPETTLLYAVKRNNTTYATYVFVDVGDGESEGGDSLSSDLLFVMRPNSDSVTTKDGTVYTYENVMKNGTKETVTADSDMLNYPGLYWDVRYNKDDQITGVKRVVWDSTGILTSSGNTTAISGTASNSGHRWGKTFSGTVSAEDGVVTVGGYTLPAMAENFNIRVIEMDGNDRNIVVSTSSSVGPVDRHFKDISTSGAAFWVLDSGDDFVTDLYIMYNKANNQSTVQRTITGPAAVTAAAPKGGYTATVTESSGTANDGKASQGTTVTVTVTCTAAPTGVDTITLTGVASPSGTLTWSGSTGTVGTITFAMPDSNVTLGLSVTNAPLPKATAPTGTATVAAAGNKTTITDAENVVLTVSGATAGTPAEGEPAASLKYQWYKMNSASDETYTDAKKVGTSATTFTVDGTTLGVGTYYYRCAVYNQPTGYSASDPKTSAAITITVNAAPGTTPGDLENVAGNDSVAGSGTLGGTPGSTATVTIANPVSSGNGAIAVEYAKGTTPQDGDELTVQIAVPSGATVTDDQGDPITVTSGKITITLTWNDTDGQWTYPASITITMGEAGSQTSATYDISIDEAQ